MTELPATATADVKQSASEYPRFVDRFAIVTGGASGIGLATAIRLASGGARIVVADLDGDAAAKAVVAARAAGAPDAFPSICNVSHEADVSSCVAAAVERFGRLD